MPNLIARLGELSDALTDLGARSTPYSKTFPGREVRMQNDGDPVLEPYRSLDADRLKLVGRGHWDPTPFLGDTLAMAFRNPDSLLLDRDLKDVDLPTIRETEDEIAKLCRVWDKQDLLLLHGCNIPDLFPEETVRIFNAYKSSSHDRQIGDRRGRNAVEARVEGPSRNLPNGTDLCELYVKKGSQSIHISVTDRRDFYHQIQASYTRALSNTVGPGVPAWMVEDTSAFATLMLTRSKKKSDRMKMGDQLHSSTLDGRDGSWRGEKTDVLFASFKSVLQGDHGGVEYACEGHANLLMDYGLLREETRLVSDKPFKGRTLLDGLCIDDYFVVAVQDNDDDGTPQDRDCLQRAKQAYDDFALLGSDDKDISSQNEARVIGAHINGGKRAQDLGFCTLGSSPEKRYGLSMLTLRIAQLSHTTDVLHLCLLGAWTSVLLYRRALMSLLGASFGLVDADKVETNVPKLVPLPRRVADELVMVSILSVYAVTDLCAPFDDTVYCSDASDDKGAFCQAPIGSEVSEILWKCSRSKGAYHRLLSPAEKLHRRLDLLEEFGTTEKAHVERPLAFHYDFIEVFAGAGKISAELSKYALVIGPPVDLSHSPEYNVEWEHVISWLTFMVSTRRVLAFMCEPPCTTFSLMRKPPLRSRLFPYGFDTRNSQTYNGNLLCQRSCQMMHVGLQNQAIGLLEKPFTSLMKHMPSYKALLNKPEVFEVRTDSCMFGSIHQKSFALLGFGLTPSYFVRRCDRSHRHVKVEGQYTKSSATYCDDLAERIAYSFYVALTEKKEKIRSDDDIQVKGLENQLSNVVMMSREWKVGKVWNFRGKSHINIKELSSLYKLVVALSKEKQSTRVTSFVDSFVVSAAASKGRSSSFGLTPILKKLDATVVAAGIYLSIPFIPTRLNAADDPTRNVAIREQSGSLAPDDFTRAQLFQLSALPKLRRWTSNWVRIVLSLLGPTAMDLGDRSLFRQSCSRGHSAAHAIPVLPASTLHDVALDFDQTLGFPGEGPCPLSCVSNLLVCLRILALFLSISDHGCCWVVLAPLGSAGLVSAMDVGPRNPADRSRQAARQVRPPLPKGRPVLPVTSANRQVLYDAFSTWCFSEGINVEQLLEHASLHTEELNALMTTYGKKLYESGRPYGHYAESINALVQQCPNLRRLMQPAWDLAFSWAKSEPPTHRLAMPWQIFLALLTVALSWGWLDVAGSLALIWGGVLRPGELLASKRSDLLLPSDTHNTNAFALLAIEEPKTRYSAARHQCAKIDSSDILQVLELCFGHLPLNRMLWPSSGQSLRARFRNLLAALKLPVSGPFALELSSLRPGAATWLLQVSENAELVRRRGRWLSSRVMEIYVQETSAARMMINLSHEQRTLIFTLAHNFLYILGKATEFQNCRIPTKIWYRLLSTEI